MSESKVRELCEWGMVAKEISKNQNFKKCKNVIRILDMAFAKFFKP